MWRRRIGLHVVAMVPTFRNRVRTFISRRKTCFFRRHTPKKLYVTTCACELPCTHGVFSQCRARRRCARALLVARGWRDGRAGGGNGRGAARVSVRLWHLYCPSSACSCRTRAPLHAFATARSRESTVSCHHHRVHTVRRAAFAIFCALCNALTMTRVESL
jgi:hypothetical protein